MMRRFLYWLREVVWVAVIAVALAVVGIILALLGWWEIALVITSAGIIFSLLSIRS